MDMTTSLVQAMQLVGTLLAVGLGSLALVWYVALWPFDRATKVSPW